MIYLQLFCGWFASSCNASILKWVKSAHELSHRLSMCCVGRGTYIFCDQNPNGNHGGAKTCTQQFHLRCVLKQIHVKGFQLNFKLLWLKLHSAPPLFEWGQPGREHCMFDLADFYSDLPDATPEAFGSPPRIKPRTFCLSDEHVNCYSKEPRLHLSEAAKQFFFSVKRCFNNWFLFIFYPYASYVS